MDVPDASPGLPQQSSIISGSRRAHLQTRKSQKRMTSVKSNNRLSVGSRGNPNGLNTIDVNMRDDASDISDITNRSRSCLRKCCVEKEKIMSKVLRNNCRKASKIRESSVMSKGGGGGSGNPGRSSLERQNPFDVSNMNPLLMQSQLTSLTNMTMTSNTIPKGQRKQKSQNKQPSSTRHQTQHVEIPFQPVGG